MTRRHGNWRSPEEKFWPKVDKQGLDDCWEWTAARLPRGYGVLHSVRPDLNESYAHRIAWVLENGAIPENCCVCHTCDNPGCVNPNHLFLGTQRDNMYDMISKGRSRSVGLAGEENPSAKLDEASVRAIRASKDSRASLARQYGLRRGHIWMIQTGRSWGHVQ